MENTDLFPNMVIQMIAVGEEAGALDAMSAKVASFYEAEVDNAVDSMSSLLEPLIMAVLGVLVGGWSSPCTCRSSSSAQWCDRTAGGLDAAAGRRRVRARAAGRQLPERGSSIACPVMLERAWRREALLLDGKEPPAEPAYDLVRPRSACPSCKAPITALQNIPVISWLLLRGRCAGCRTPISARYPLGGAAHGADVRPRSRGSSGSAGPRPRHCC